MQKIMSKGVQNFTSSDVREHRKILLQISSEYKQIN